MVQEHNNDLPQHDDKPNLPETPADAPATPPSADEAAASAPPPPANDDASEDMNERLERLGGEPAPAITPEEFARLQKAGRVHIDSGGRVRTARRRDDDEGGVSLRKRRAWYC